MNKNKIIGWCIGICGGYLLSHYLISPFIFGEKMDEKTQLVQSLNLSIEEQRQQLPLKVDEVTTLIAIDQRDLKIAYTYKVDSAFIQNNAEELRRQEFRENLCQSVRKTFELDIHYDFIYKDENSHTIESFPIDKTTCSI
jgi:hypothetical protein